MWIIKHLRYRPTVGPTNQSMVQPVMEVLSALKNANKLKKQEQIKKNTLKNGIFYLNVHFQKITQISVYDLPRRRFLLLRHFLLFFLNLATTKKVVIYPWSNSLLKLQTGLVILVLL